MWFGNELLKVFYERMTFDPAYPAWLGVLYSTYGIEGEGVEVWTTLPKVSIHGFAHVMAYVCIYSNTTRDITNVSY